MTLLIMVSRLYIYTGMQNIIIINALMNYLHRPVSVISNFGRGTSPVLPKIIQCTRDDSIFSECSTTYQVTSQCQHVAGVICEGL